LGDHAAVPGRLSGRHARVGGGGVTNNLMSNCQGGVARGARWLQSGVVPILLIIVRRSIPFDLWVFCRLYLERRQKENQSHGSGRG